VAAALVATMGLVIAQGMGGAEPAQAVCTVGMGRWLNSSNTPFIRSNVPAAWNPSVRTAINRWNGIPGSTLHYNPPHFDTHFFENPLFDITLVSHRNIGLPDVPGITIGAEAPGHSWSVIFLNSDFSWNAAGIHNRITRKVDIQTILVHEVGHASGLAHPGACGPTTPAERAGVMFVSWTVKRVPNADDKSGIARRY
jgi:hypothetical protein